MKKLEVPTDSVPEFELGDTAADIQQRKEKREAKKGGRGTETEGGFQEEGSYTHASAGSAMKACKVRQK